MQQHLFKYQPAALCEALAVSRSGYHAWQKRSVNPAKLQFTQVVSNCHTQHKTRAGAPSIAVEIQAQGFTVGRIMQCLNLRA